MFLLFRKCGKVVDVRWKEFTFQYVSIISKLNKEKFLKSELFTFQYVSIIS